MPTPQQGSSNGRSFSLFIQGVNVTGYVPADAVQITETAGASNPTMEFVYERPSTSALSWLQNLSQDVELRDNSNDRRLFKGNLVNARRFHHSGTQYGVRLTALGYSAWLDRLVLPKWVSKRPNGTNMSTDREMVQAVTAAVGTTPAGQFAWDAPNAYVSSTNASMPVVKVEEGGSVASILQAIAEAAATEADPTARRFYVDFDNHLHYFKGSESTTAPYLIGDASYTTTVKATSGLVSLWALREASGTTCYDAMGYANATLAGGYTQNVASLVPNESAMAAVTLNGSSGYATASGANLHPGDTFSVELWFQRGSTGSTQTMVSAGSGDFEIGFNSSDQIVVYKEGTGNNFVTDATYTSTSTPYHLVVTRTPGTTTVYVNGVSKAGTATARTFVAAAGAVNVGRRLSSTDRYFSGTLQDVAIYSTQLSAATALAHYNDGWTLVPDEFEFESDCNNAGVGVYIKGSTASGSGWVTQGGVNYRQTFLLDRPESSTSSLKTAIGRGFLAREAQTLHGGRAVVTGFDGWRAGQTLTIDNATLGIGGSNALTGSYEIKQIDTYPNMGSGVITYELNFGVLPWSGTFDVQRKRRRR